MQIPILRIPFTEADISFVQESVKEVMQSGLLTMGKFTKLFEEKFKDFVNVKYSISTNNCTSALEIILRAIGVEGCTVIVPTNTFVATPFAAIHAGAKVIFVDSMKDNFSIDPEDLKKKIGKDTKAVIIVHIGGIISPHIQEIKEICDDKGVCLIEDCAHAHGCSYKGIPAGRWGIAAAFSFFPTKVFVCGEGGIIVTDKERLYKKSIILRNHGKDPKFNNSVTHLGHNWRMNEFTAILGVQQLNNSKRIISERQRVARYYDAYIQKIPGIQPLLLDKKLQSSYYKYICYLDKEITRAKFKRALKDKYDINLTGEVYETPCHDEPYFKNERKWVLNAHDAFPQTDYIKKHHICLPCYSGLKEEELKYVVESIKECLEDYGRL